MLGQIQQSPNRVTINIDDVRLICYYEYKLESSAVETARKVNRVFGAGTINDRTVQWWFKKFRTGNVGAECDTCGRAESYTEAEQLKGLIQADQRQTVREIASRLEINRHLTAMAKKIRNGKMDERTSRFS